MVSKLASLLLEFHRVGGLVGQMQTVRLAGGQVIENLEEAKAYQRIPDRHDEQYFPALDWQVVELDAYFVHLADVDRRAIKNETDVHQTQRHCQHRHQASVGCRQQLDQRIDTDMRSDAYTVRNPDKDHDREKHAGHLQAP